LSFKSTDFWFTNLQEQKDEAPSICFTKLSTPNQNQQTRMEQTSTKTKSQPARKTTTKHKSTTQELKYHENKYNPSFKTSKQRNPKKNIVPSLVETLAPNPKLHPQKRQTPTGTSSCPKPGKSEAWKLQSKIQTRIEN
jgi:hypothetical protein